MTTSKYFNHFNHKGSQSVIENLVIETIQLAGLDLIYIKRNSIEPDYLYKEDAINSFTEKFTIEMMVKSVDGFGGDTELMTKFGLDIKDTVTLTVSKSRIESVLGSKPFSGDLIYIPMTNSLFEIQRLDDDEPFYQLGQNLTYDLTCELFQYSQEDISVGDDTIDQMIGDLSIDDDVENEPSYENVDIEDEANLYDRSNSLLM